MDLAKAVDLYQKAASVFEVILSDGYSSSFTEFSLLENLD